MKSVMAQVTLLLMVTSSMRPSSNRSEERTNQNAYVIQLILFFYISHVRNRNEQHLQFFLPINRRKLSRKEGDEGKSPAPLDDIQNGPVPNSTGGFYENVGFVASREQEQGMINI